MRYLTSLLLAFLAFGAHAQNVTFQVDMSEYNEAYAYDTVYVNGSFNSWCGGCNPLTDQGNGIWSATLPLTAGTIEYKFTLDGWSYQEELAGIAGIGACTSTLGGFTNRTLTFDADVVLPAVCWESCAACGEVIELPTYELTFNVNMQNEDVSPDGLFLAGGLAFGEGWNVPAQELLDADGDDIYSVTLSVDSGFSSDYTFVNGIGWGNKENIAGQDCAVAPFNDRRLDPMSGPETVNTCFAVCSTDGSCPEVVAPAGPMDNAAVPTLPAEDVVSVFSDSYVDIATNYNPNWGQSTQVDPAFDPGTGNLILAYTNFNYQGTDLTPTDLSGKSHIHMDVWVEAGATGTLRFSPINSGTGSGEFLVDVPVTPGAWNSVDLAKADFTGQTWDSVFQLKYDGALFGGSEVYLDNIYFWGEDTSGDISGCMDSTANNYNADATVQPENACLYDVTLSVDASQTSFSTMCLAGSFQGWIPEANPMTDNGDGTFSITVSMGAGTQDYKFIGDCGWPGAESFDGSEPCTMEPGEFVNRLIEINGPTNAPVVCYNSCSACIPNAILGCLDINANNYNAEADTDDGSCLYNTTFNVDMSCAGTEFYEVFVTGPSWGWPANSGWNQLTDADGDGTYSVTFETPAGDVEYKYGIDGFSGQENLIDDMQNGASCAPVTDFSGYANRIVLSGSSTSDTYGSCSSCPVLGCTDLAACNYNSEADLDDSTCIFATAGCTECMDGALSLVDADGDGVCDGEEIVGCQDESACNYDATATDAGACDLPDALTGCGDTCLDGGVLYEFVINDQYDDGMCCTYGEGSYSIVVDGVVIASGGDFGSSATERFCAPAEACVQIVMVADNFPGEQTWSMSADGVEVLGSGLNGATATYYLGGCMLGCMDSSACNYDSMADVDDGSCLQLDACGVCGGPGVDTDGDGVCDSAEIAGCQLADACNYDATATDAGDCTYPSQDYLDCNEECINDADGDGVCDEIEIPGCLVPSACNYNPNSTDLVTCIYPGCMDSAACNYDANAGCDDGSCLMLDAVGVCGGDCEADDDGDGVCNNLEVLGCTDVLACNYSISATEPDGSCEYCSCALDGDGGQDGFGLAVEEHAENGIDGLTTYRLYVTTPGPSDFVSSISGDCMNPSFLRTSTSFYQNELGSLTAGVINPAFFSTFPELEYDSWLTIGIDQAPGEGTQDVTLAQAAGDTWGSDFEAGGNLEINSFFGGSWFTTNLVSNGIAGDDNRVLVAQLTTDGTLTGQLYVQVFPGGDGDAAQYLTLSFGNSSCGCTDDSIAFDGVSYAACNYNPSATYDDGSCTYAAAENLDCDGVCFNDADGDGVCDEDEILGCQDDSLNPLGGYNACNYNPDATDAGECEYVAPSELPSQSSGLGCSSGCGLFFSGYAEGSSNNKFLEIFNPTDAAISLDGYAFPNVSNAPTVPGEYEFWNLFPAGAEIAAGDVYVIAHPSADPAILAEADHTFNFLSNGDDGFMLAMGTEDDFIQIDAIGDWNGDPGSGWAVAGVSNGTKDHSLIRKADISTGNGGDWISSAGTNADDSEWIVLDQNDWTGLGSHANEYWSNFAVVYDCDGTCFNDSNGDGICDELTVLGCMDLDACNYSEDANNDDGSCEYPEQFYGCDGACLNDANINGICDELEVLGCTYAAACNYNMDANVDDGQCDFSCIPTGCQGTDVVQGCTVPDAGNYDPAATCDNGSCVFSNECRADLDDDGLIGMGDLLEYLSLFGSSCE